MLAALKRDGALFAFIGLYALLICLLALAIGKTDKIVAFVYLYRWVGALPLLVLWLAVRSLRHESPVRGLIQDTRSLFTPERLVSLLLFLAISVHHGMFTSAKTMLPDLVGFTWDVPLSELDRALHGGVDPWRLLTFLDPITPWVQRAYEMPWFFCVVTFPLAACLLDSFKPFREQFLWTYVLAWALLGNVMAGLFMSAGPPFYEKLTGDPQFRPVIDNLASHFPGGVIPYHQLLWNAYTKGLAEFGTGISAFPSMHVAMATLFFLAALRLNRWFAGMMFAFLFVIQLGSVHTGWHYAVDGYASILLTLGLWKVVGWALAGGTAPAVQPA